MVEVEEQKAIRFMGELTIYMVYERVHRHKDYHGTIIVRNNEFKFDYSVVVLEEDLLPYDYKDPRTFTFIAKKIFEHYPYFFGENRDKEFPGDPGFNVAVFYDSEHFETFLKNQKN